MLSDPIQLGLTAFPACIHGPMHSLRSATHQRGLRKLGLHRHFDTIKVIPVLAER